LTEITDIENDYNKTLPANELEEMKEVLKRHESVFDKFKFGALFMTHNFI
jgi:hypothetical protein